MIAPEALSSIWNFSKMRERLYGARPSMQVPLQLLRDLPDTERAAMREFLESTATLPSTAVVRITNDGITVVTDAAGDRL
jgi:hypothetical protein